LNFDNCYLNLKIAISILKIVVWIWKLIFEIWKLLFEPENWYLNFDHFYFNLKISIKILWNKCEFCKFFFKYEKTINSLKKFEFGIEKLIQFKILYLNSENW
jgi:hypothetical protein